jgi:phosphopantetheine--protein transferase-like protein
MNGLAGLRIGIDLAAVIEFEQMLTNPAALARLFTPLELSECLSRQQDAGAALARRFAAKEALLKACGVPDFDLAAIEIRHDPSGAPFAAWNYLDQHALECRLSVSSSGDFAVAVAIVAKQKQP